MPEGTCSTPACDKPVLCRGVCSSCYGKARYRRRGLPVQSRVCLLCAAEFIPADPRRIKYCTPECARIANNRRGSTGVKPRKAELCLNCGHPLSGQRRDARACSARCRDRLKYLAARELRIAQAAAWAKANPEAKRKAATRRRARKFDNSGGVGVSARDWKRLVNRFDGRCAYCGVRPEQLDQDHVIPLSLGGRDAIGNILPACRSCNSSKSDRLLIDWRVGYRKAAGIRIELRRTA